MSLNENEQVLLEALDAMLQDDAKLGLRDHKKAQEEAGKNERGFEYLHGQIDEMFHLKAAESEFFNSLCAAFAKVHNYKYITDPTFNDAMDRELISQGIPSKERIKAQDIVGKIIDELKAEKTNWATSDCGFHPDMDEVTKMPESNTELKIIE